MEVDTLGSLCAKTMDQIQDHDFGGKAFIRTALVVVEVDTGDQTAILVTSTEDRTWVRRALLDEAIDTVLAQGVLSTGEDED